MGEGAGLIPAHCSHRINDFSSTTGGDKPRGLPWLSRGRPAFARITLSASHTLSNLIQFVANYNDLSTDKGFQFKFNCDMYRNGYMSRFQPNAIGIAGSLLQAASSLFGWLGGAENAAYHIQRAVGGIKYPGFRDPDGNTWTLQKITPRP